MGDRIFGLPVIIKNKHYMTYLDKHDNLYYKRNGKKIYINFKQHIDEDGRIYIKYGRFTEYVGRRPQIKYGRFTQYLD